VQRNENERKNSVLNYESPALTAELQARRALTREHPTANVQRPIVTEAAQVFFETLPLRFVLVFCPCDHGLRVRTNSRFEFISRWGPTAFRHRSLSSVIDPVKSEGTQASSASQ